MMHINIKLVILIALVESVTVKKQRNWTLIVLICFIEVDYSLRQMNRVNSRTWLCHDYSTVNIVVSITITYSALMLLVWFVKALL